MKDNRPASWESAITAKLMLVILSHSYNQTLPDEYRQVLEYKLHRFAIVWTPVYVKHSLIIVCRHTHIEAR